jgi:hypothetical protein
MSEIEEIGDKAHLTMDNRGEVHVQRVPIIRLSKGEDEQGREMRLIKHLNWLDHNPTPGWPRQGRKKGQGRNRAKARGKSKGGEAKEATVKKRK